MARLEIAVPAEPARAWPNAGSAGPPRYEADCSSFVLW